MVTVQLNRILSLFYLSSALDWFCLLSLTGLRKQKEYDWKDSNVALLGSDEDREVKSEFLLLNLLEFYVSFF